MIPVLETDMQMLRDAQPHKAHRYPDTPNLFRRGRKENDTRLIIELTHNNYVEITNGSELSFGGASIKIMDDKPLAVYDLAESKATHIHNAQIVGDLPNTGEIATFRVLSL